MRNTSDPKHEEYARLVKEFEAAYGEDWDGTMIEYDNDFVSLPTYVGKAAGKGNSRIVLQWLGKGNIREMVNAKCEDAGNAGLLFMAASTQQLDLMSYLLLNGANVNILNSTGRSTLTAACLSKDDHLGTVRLLPSWGGDLYLEGEGMTKDNMSFWRDYVTRKGDAAIAKLISSELGGRRCEIVGAARGNLIGKTCVVEEYIENSDQYKVTVEYTNEVLLLGVDNLKRRDRTPQDPGYYVECKNNRLIRRDFKSNEDCQAFIASLRSDKEESVEDDPDAEAKAEQAAADLLAELGLDDLGGPSSKASKQENQPATSGKKKKKHGSKKKGRK